MASLSLVEEEAMATVNELPFAVDSIAISDALPRTDELIYINITTCEQKSYCLELTAHGWRVVSTRHDHLDEQPENKELSGRYFETAYQFLDVVSPAYRQRFGNKLIAELYKLSNDKEHSPPSERL
uniref:GSKIP_dom domain-containing protein n=2 Tax=Ascaris TaxID=6251 RepID=A0A0M3IG34_ASCLU